MKRTSTEVRAKIQLWLTLFIVGLVLSGLTAFPLETELRILSSMLGINPAVPASDYSGPQHWIALVATALHESYAKYPFLAYGTDWLAFAHLVIAVAFIGPLRDPLRNVWIIDFGMI